MFYLEYDLPQLIRIAEDRLRIFDAERLKVPKPLDALDFIELENGLNLRLDPQRLTPNLSIWGLTAFNDGYWWVWPEDAEMPVKHSVQKGTILIDERLLQPEVNAGLRNFTILHEGFHWVLHQKVFRRQKVALSKHFSKEDINVRIGNRKPAFSGIKITEWQANAAAAAFLMPGQAVTHAFLDILKIPQKKTLPIKWTSEIDNQIFNMANMFSASYSAMKYRLLDLGLLTGIGIAYSSEKTNLN